MIFCPKDNVKISRFECVRCSYYSAIAGCTFGASKSIRGGLGGLGGVPSSFGGSYYGGSDYDSEYLRRRRLRG